MALPHDKEDSALLSAINEIVITKGPKACTMDYVAKSLQMSKRTLYEIFEDKNDMIIRAMEHRAATDRKAIQSIIENAPDMMTAFMRIFMHHRIALSKVNSTYFKDMDRLYPRLRKNYESRHRRLHRDLKRIFEKGVMQGVFRNDINIDVLIHVMLMQSETFKQMEDKFPEGITLLDVYDSSIGNFLRGIASAKGAEIIDSYIRRCRESGIPETDCQEIGF